MNRFLHYSSPTLILALDQASAFFSVQCQLLTLVASGLSSTIHLGIEMLTNAFAQDLPWVSFAPLGHLTQSLRQPLDRAAGRISETEQECVQTKFWETSGKIVVSDCNSVEVGCAAAGLRVVQIRQSTAVEQPGTSAALCHRRPDILGLPTL